MSFVQGRRVSESIAPAFPKTKLGGGGNDRRPQALAEVCDPLVTEVCLASRIAASRCCGGLESSRRVPPCSCPMAAPDRDWPVNRPACRPSG